MTKGSLYFNFKTMPEFEYKAVDPAGLKLQGSLVAENLSQAKGLLKSRGLIILELKEKVEDNPFLKGNFLLFQKKIRDRDLYNLFRELSILLRSGLTLDRALSILLETTTNPILRRSLEKVQKGIREGKSISQAFRETNLLPPLMLSMISAGEAIGKLASAFENMADFYQFRIQFKNEIKSALTYPLFLVTASIITVFIVFRFILPKFFSLFADLHLPLPSKILYSFGLALSHIKWYHLPLIFFLLLFLLRTPLWPLLKERFTQVFTKLPLIKGFIKDLDYARFSHSMYSMLKSGIEFVDALYLSKNIILNEDLRQFLDHAILEIRKGHSIAEVFKNTTYFSPVYYNMLKVGEESGNLKEIFWELYNMHDENFKNNVKRLLSLLEPIIITLTGLIIGFIVISLILTVMSAGVIRF